MRTIGYRNKESAYATQDYALERRYPCRISYKVTDDGVIYFVWVDDMTVEQSEELNDFARTKKGLLWLSNLKGFYDGVNRAWDEWYD